MTIEQLGKHGEGDRVMTNKNWLPKSFAIFLFLALTLGGTALVISQQSPRRRRGPDPSTVDRPYTGIVTAEGAVEGLFPIYSTGVSTAPIVKAADSFLAALTDEQRARTEFDVADKEWRKWDNRHFYKRQGVGFDEMTAEQRESAFGLMSASLSAEGLKKSKDIMKLNGTLAELANDFDEYGEWLYWITVMGKPSADEPWGWQIDGHHLVVNFFVLGDQVVMSPVFMGSEPIRAEGGKFKGTEVMQTEQDKGLRMIQSLTEEQLQLAVVNYDKPGNNNLSEAYKDNLVLDYAGIPGSELDEKQQKLLLDLIGEYVGNMRDEHAKVKMSEVKEHMSKTYFAWIGQTTEDATYYYRIHSPVVLIEFDHQRRVAPFRSRTPTREHIHTVVRTPNGNDYGKDLLRQHYEAHHAEN